jgi:hypothetical protein
MLPQGFFIRTLSVERKRMERSGRHFERIVQVDRHGILLYQDAGPKFATELPPSCIRRRRASSYLAFTSGLKLKEGLMKAIEAHDAVVPLAETNSQDTVRRSL